MNTEHADQSNGDSQVFIKYLSRHLVVLCGTYQIGESNPPVEKHFTYSGCIVSVNDSFFILTAGHAIKNFTEATKCDSFRLTSCVLADYFGIDAKHAQSYPYNIDACAKLVQFDEVSGLDFALLEIDDILKRNLEANGILPFPLWVDGPSPVVNIDQYGLLGFPDDRTDLIATPLSRKTEIGVRPVYLVIQRLEDDTQKVCPRFAANLLASAEEIRSIVGTSGGPIIGLSMQDDGTSRYYLIAIQSTWDRNSRKIYATLMSAIQISVRNTIESRRRESE